MVGNLHLTIQFLERGEIVRGRCLRRTSLSLCSVWGALESGRCRWEGAVCLWGWV